MKIAIMQPYLFPYIGYFQLLDAVDKFVFYDDVQYMKGGWINRNRFLVNGHDQFFTFPLKRTSLTDKINTKEFVELQSTCSKFLDFIKVSYKKSAYYEIVTDLIRRILSFDCINISHWIYNSLIEINSYLGINTPIVKSSEIIVSDNLKGESRVIEICKLLEAKVYVNLSGGIGLYNKENFKAANLDLFFIKSNPIEYIQYDNEFISNLSIVDVMMFNSQEQIKNLLGEYKLI